MAGLSALSLADKKLTLREWHPKWPGAHSRPTCIAR
jgi:hypothetical protein